MNKILFSMILCLLLAANTIWADTLELTNGKKIEGTFVGRSDGSVKFEVDGITITYDEKDVKNISFGSSHEKTETTAHEAPATSEVSNTAGSVTVPAGTMLLVRTKEPLDSSRQKAGHKFTAVLEADLVVDRTVVAPRGSNVYGELIDAKQAGRVAGKSEMTITFTGLMINNQIRPIQTGAIQAVAESDQAKNTASKVVRGAAIGGLVDGKSGARTGAKVGTGAALLTRGGKINIPANTLLEVPLAEPFTS
ncbi:MAG: hypothetical protein JRE14_08200 [Deltaproteobacteria bacterium]|nr:hypothetical protein [Deltaproteobacteria bacterium]